MGGSSSGVYRSLPVIDMMLARNNLEMGDVIFNWVRQSVPPGAMTCKTKK